MEITKMHNNVYWIGGSSCSGKSSCAKKMSAKYGMYLYNTDEYAFGKYMFALEDISKYPAIEKYKNQICAGVENFIHRDTDISYKAFIDYCHEVFPLLVKDIEELSKKQSVIVEGAHILPELISALNQKSNCIFLISSEEQQRDIWLKEMHKEISGGNEHEINDYEQTENKKLFEKTRIDLHQKIAEHIQREAEKSNMKTIIVNKGNSFEKILETVETQVFIKKEV